MAAASPYPATPLPPHAAHRAYGSGSTTRQLQIEVMSDDLAREGSDGS